MDIDLEAAISDGTDSLDLELTVANGDSVPRSGIGVGARSWKKQTVESEYMHGRYVTSQKLDVQFSLLVVRVGGTTTSQLFSRITALTNAIEQGRMDAAARHRRPDCSVALRDGRQRHRQRLG